MRTIVLYLALFLVAVFVRPASADKKADEAKKKAEAEKKKKAEAEKKKKKEKPGKFDGMIVMITGSNVTIKHSNGTGKGFDIAKASISGLGGKVQSQKDLKKGQIVVVHHTGKKATKIDVKKQAAASPVLVGKVEHYVGTVENVKADQFGDNGKIWVKGPKGVKEFLVHNETNIDYKKNGKTIVHTLQGVGKGMKVTITHQGKQATHIDCIMK